MDEPMKRCGKCEVEQPLDAFAADLASRDGLRSWCRGCARHIGKAHRSKFTEAGLCATGCGGRCVAGAKACFFCLLAKQITNAVSASRNLANGRSRGESGDVNAQLGSRHTGVFEARKRIGMDLWRKSGGVCIYTGERLIPGVNVALDHILPLSRGGTNDPSNLQLVSTRANMAKGDMTHDEFVASCSAIARVATADDEFVHLRRLVSRRMAFLGPDLANHAFIAVA